MDGCMHAAVLSLPVTCDRSIDPSIPYPRVRPAGTCTGRRRWANKGGQRQLETIQVSLSVHMHACRPGPSAIFFIFNLFKQIPNLTQLFFLFLNLTLLPMPKYVVRPKHAVAPRASTRHDLPCRAVIFT